MAAGLGDESAENSLGNQMGTIYIPWECTILNAFYSDSFRSIHPGSEQQMASQNFIRVFSFFYMSMDSSACVGCSRMCR